MLTIIIPAPGDEATFLDIDVTYDVIATEGPPSPPLDTVLTGWTFIECWRLDPEAEGCLTIIDLGYPLPPRWVRYIDKYIKDNFPAIQKNCRDFELTRPNNVV